MSTPIKPAPMVKIDAAVLRAALVVCGKYDVRYYLNGVYVDTRDPKQIDVVSTDGHRMFAHRAPLKDETPEALRRQWILRRDDLNAVLKGAEFFYLTGVDEDSAKVLTTGKSNRRRALVQLIDGRFPDWAPVLAAALAAQPGNSGLNPSYVGDFHKMGKLLGRCYPMIQSKGEEAAAVVTFNDDYSIGLVMPMRGGTVSLPKWTDALPSPAEKKAA